ncbi:hypothetical protein COD94_28775 [Bacillus cereus]|uniref:YolD-like family protein n=1 Tax=Bacillus cereus TaxID=1396 RepID=UPI0009AEB34F|nr:YolD-like family protein [Bacillus cereus]PGV55573.1 hypothetical protein COD94_28775 [Bacillus cereus]
MFSMSRLVNNFTFCNDIKSFYHEDGYLLTSYMTIVDIDLLNSAVICTDSFYNKMKLQFSNIIDVK